jgi:hypothetical protein
MAAAAEEASTSYAVALAVGSDKPPAGEAAQGAAEPGAAQPAARWQAPPPSALARMLAAQSSSGRLPASTSAPQVAAAAATPAAAGAEADTAGDAPAVGQALSVLREVLRADAAEEGGGGGGPRLSGDLSRLMSSVPSGVPLQRAASALLALATPTQLPPVTQALALRAGSLHELADALMQAPLPRLRALVAAQLPPAGEAGGADAAAVALSALLGAASSTAQVDAIVDGCRQVCLRAHGRRFSRAAAVATAALGAGRARSGPPHASPTCAAAFKTHRAGLSGPGAAGSCAGRAAWARADGARAAAAAAQSRLSG